MPSGIWGFILISTAIVITPAPLSAEAASNESGFLRSAYGGGVRALVIGIDQIGNILDPYPTQRTGYVPRVGNCPLQRTHMTIGIDAYN